MNAGGDTPRLGVDSPARTGPRLVTPPATDEGNTVEWSIEEAARLAKAYRECKETRDRLSRMLRRPADAFAGEVDRAGEDAAVLAAIDEVRSLAKHTMGWLDGATAWVTSLQRRVDWADEASLDAARSEVDPVCAAAAKLVKAAGDPLDVVQRAALGRHLVSELGHADRVWGPDAAQKYADAAHYAALPGKTVNYTPLGHLVDQQIAYLRSRRLFRRMQLTVERGTLTAPAGTLAFRRPGRRRRRFKRRWTELHFRLMAVEARCRDVEAAGQRLQDAHGEVVAQRRRAELEAQRQERLRAEEAEADRQAAETQRLEREAKALRKEFEALGRAWPLSSRQLRAHGWEATLLWSLTVGVYDDEGTVIVKGLERQRAMDVLRLLQLAADHGERTGERLIELLASEDDLIGRRAGLLERARRLADDSGVRAHLADCHPRLRPACEWLASHADNVLPLLKAEADTEADSLRTALGEAGGALAA